MKFIQLFTKIPNYKKFGYMPRHYDPREDERKERELRIRMELDKDQDKVKKEDIVVQDYRTRISGSFRTAKKTVSPQADPSSSMVRLIITMIITVGLIGFLQYGKIALVGVALVIIPFYLYLKFRKFRR
jgi:Flp pilus assembly protein TadB